MGFPSLRSALTSQAAARLTTARGQVLGESCAPRRQLLAIDVVRIEVPSAGLSPVLKHAVPLDRCSQRLPSPPAAPRREESAGACLGDPALCGAQRHVADLGHRC